MPRNFLWSERLRSSDQTIWAVQGMKRPLAFRTNGISALEFNCLDRRMNAPLRLRFSVVPSTMLVRALIETGHFTLALVWRRLSVPITACEIMCRRFFVVPLQRVLNWIQTTGMRTEDAGKIYPHRPYADGGQTGGMNKVSAMLTHGFTNANRMPIKKAEPKLRSVFGKWVGYSEGNLAICCCGNETTTSDS